MKFGLSVAALRDSFGMESGAGVGGDDLDSLASVQQCAEQAASDRQKTEMFREVAEARALNHRLSPELRRQWAKLSLQINTCVHGDGPWDQSRMVRLNAWLRAQMIEQLGPDLRDPYWNPGEVVADVLNAVTLTPSQARALCVAWQGLPLDQIAVLRRIKNVTHPLELLLPHVQPGALRDQAEEWLTIRQLLP
ncbi:hypothetical protein [Streptomyces antibioticus]|uniref:Uncharacterized protein n=1 Tax=Streptomyces antibioticus TaxID=1890 RepID=A0AAE6Y2P7_STRAT|nr:hypothetical protein [Streptomyces antibioticus]QIT42228.1 hypothetical protein HCX60_00705 [Streptomyces antibioticus]